MSVVLSEEQPNPAGCGEPGAPRMPIVMMSSDDRQLDVFYVATEAADAAKENPAAEWFDVAGNVLRLGDQQDSPPRLEVCGQADPAELQRRVMSALRSAAERGAPDGGVSDEVERALAWIGKSPGFPEQVHALGFARCSPHPRDIPSSPHPRDVSSSADPGVLTMQPHGGSCDPNCSWWKKMMHPGACC